jgi:hypothetical protein
LTAPTTTDKRSWEKPPKFVIAYGRVVAVDSTLARNLLDAPSSTVEAWLSDLHSESL